MTTQPKLTYTPSKSTAFDNYIVRFNRRYENGDIYMPDCFSDSTNDDPALRSGVWMNEYNRRFFDSKYGDPVTQSTTTPTKPPEDK